MESTLTFGVILATGFLAAEAMVSLGFPKVTGYILAGILLNPKLNSLIPGTVVTQSSVITNFSLAFITFSVGGSLLWPQLKRLGKSIVAITIFEAEFAALTILLSFVLLGPFLFPGHHPMTTWILPLALLMGALGSPTDPSATLAVVHQYKAKGPVTDTILGVTAFDDVAGILNYSFASVIALVLVSGKGFSLGGSIGRPLVTIFGAIGLGATFGALLVLISRYVMRKDTEGALIVLIFGMLGLCFGLAKHLELDELLATMSMGMVVINASKRGPKIFAMLERYTEELVFVLFFTISGMLLDVKVLLHAWPLALLFVVARAAGKLLGTITGAHISKAPAQVKKYAFGGLIPQGGIVIGLALLISDHPGFKTFSHVILSVVLGATVLHELLGPIASKFALNKAGELSGNHRADHDTHAPETDLDGSPDKPDQSTKDSPDKPGI